MNDIRKRKPYYWRENIGKDVQMLLKLNIINGAIIIIFHWLLHFLLILLIIIIFERLPQY
ncbi:hypothetical protein BLA29_013934, partial [Euroglyphus maynei]